MASLNSTLGAIKSCCRFLSKAVACFSVYAGTGVQEAE